MANNKYKHSRLVVTTRDLHEKNRNRNDAIVVAKGYSWQIIDTNITDWLQQKETNMRKIEMIQWWLLRVIRVKKIHT